MEIRGFITGLVKANPGMRSREVVKPVEDQLAVKMCGSTVRIFLKELGLSAPVDRPAERPKITPLPMAGAELMPAAELELGAVATRTKDLLDAIEQLPEPDGPVRDDRANRDERGRFLPEYNQPEARRWEELGGKCESVELKRATKDLRGMRVANTSEAALHRKNMAMMVLPTLAPAGRWDGLSHRKGDYLGELCG